MLLYAPLSIVTNCEPQDYPHNRNPQTHFPVRSPGLVAMPRSQELCPPNNNHWASPVKTALSPVSVEQRRTIPPTMSKQARSEVSLVDEEAQALAASDQTVR
jgi:hypothetical protein